MSTVSVRGRVVSGFGVASGLGPDPRFPAGTLSLQVPLFRARGVDLAEVIGAEPFMGTINVDLSPLRPCVIRPDFGLPDVKWSARMPAENFWLFRARLEHRGTAWAALIYMPDPATKPDHFQPLNVVEVIAAPIPRLMTGDEIELLADRTSIDFI